MSRSGAVSLNVGGFRYVLERSDIQKYPGSFLECLLKDEWTQGGAEVISVERDGRLFKYVSAFLMCGQLPHDEKGYINIAPDVLEKLKEEADFYGLQDLLKECELFRRTPESEKITNYMTMRTYLERLGDNYGYLDEDVVVECTREKTTKLLSALTSIHSPFCLVGRVSEFPTNFLFKQSTCDNLDVHELISVASQSAFGRGLETVTDLSFRESFEIVAENLNESTLAELAVRLDITSFAPHLHLSLEPYKLVIYKEGGHFDAHRDTVRGEGHIGTLVLILNSTYTGGELEVTHGGRTEVVTGPYSWVAMYGDCLHKINPVTSGTRVSLIYDIYGTQRPLRDLASSEPMELPESPDDVFLAAESATVSLDQAPEEPAVTRIECGATSEDCISLFDALNEELQSRDSIIICLQHLYPECQTSPLFLKGADRALYDLLTNATSNMNDHNSGQKYEVQVVAATIYRRFYLQYKKQQPEETLSGCLFSPSLLAKTLAEKPEKVDQDSWETDSESSDVQIDTNEKDSAKKAIPSCKIVIPNSINADSLLDYSPYIAQTGNEIQAEHAVYIVAGLKVRKTC